MSKYKFQEIAEFISNKINTNEINTEQYISTDNMLPNLGGISLADERPTGNRCNSFQKGDVLFSNIRTYFKKVWQAEFSGGCSADVLVMRSKDENILLTDYLYLLICNDDFINFTITSSNGAKMPRGDKKAILKYEFDVPNVDFQKSAVEIYRNFNQKIQFNTQTNQTLEQIAQAIFKSWFIDFDPIKAKAEVLANSGTQEQAIQAAMQVIVNGANTPNLRQIAEAMPSEIGEDGVPMGWEYKRIDSVANIIKGKSYKSSELAESTNALVTLKSFNRGGGYRLDGLKEYTGKYKSEQEVFAGDLIIAYTDVTQTAGVIGKPAMVMSDSRYKHLIISLDVAVIRPFDEKFKYFLYCLAMTEKFRLHTQSYCTGTTVLHLAKEAVPSFEFLNPNYIFIELFNEIAKPIFESINLAIEENKILQKIRDTLLPKLLSGELNV